MWLLLLVLLCPLAMYFMMRGMHGEHDDHADHAPPAVPTPLEILQARYARGEISREEFQQARETLTRGPGSPVA